MKAIKEALASMKECTREQASELRKAMPSASSMKTLLATRQTRTIYQTLHEIPEIMLEEQRLELKILAIRAQAIIDAEVNAESCNRCGEVTRNPVAVAVGKELYTCCTQCADYICDEIFK